MVREFVIDLFCGAGGTSTGIFLADCGSKVVFCVNHDKNAIESHRVNHPYAKHLIEDIRNPEVLFFLKLRINALRKLHPQCFITIWASLECTNFSKAKGGLPRDADSRTLAEFLFMYIEAVNPDYLMIENVVEFMSWGPLDEKGKPISSKSGIDYLKWIDNVKSYGYKFDYKELNSANYGAYTSRNRYFAQFAKPKLPIVFPEATHSKNPENTTDLFGSKPLKKWKAVREVLNLEKEGDSIFNRKKPLVEKTLQRIYAGLVKFVANGEDIFIKKYYSGRPAGKVISINGPAGTIKTTDGQAIVKCNFLLKYNSTSKTGKHVPPGIDEPCPTVATQNRLGLANINFLQSYYGNGNAHSENEPCPTVSTVDRFGKVNVNFLIDYQFNSVAKSIEKPAPTITTKDKFGVINYIMMHYSSGQKVRSIESPSGTIVGNDKHNLITANKWIQPTSFNNNGRSINEPSPTILAGRKHHYIINPQYSNPGNSIESPCPVIIARQDKKPLGLIVCEAGNNFAIPVYNDDCETMVKIKYFMAHFGIIDIKMRMLEVLELKKIQGFPANYTLIGNQTEQKKFIGNSVEVTTAKCFFKTHYDALCEYFIDNNLKF